MSIEEESIMYIMNQVHPTAAHWKMSRMTLILNSWWLKMSIEEESTYVVNEPGVAYGGTPEDEYDVQPGKVNLGRECKSTR